MRSTRSRGADGDRGSAAVEFVLVGTLVVLIGLAVVQLVIALHVRNTLTSSAYEGARHAARADRDLGDGSERATTMARDALAGLDTVASARADQVAGATVVTVSLEAPVPLVGLWGPGTMTVQARAIEEGRDG